MAILYKKMLLLGILGTCILVCSIIAADGGSVGVNYGRVANNLPSPEQAVALLAGTGITQVKLFDADKSVLAALAGTPYQVVVGFPNERIRNAARRPSFAAKWIKQNILPFLSGQQKTRITTICVGNEVLNATASGLPSQLLPAMKNLHSALVAYNLDSQVKLSSPMPLNVLSSSYPPSAGAFNPTIAGSVVKPFLDFLAATGSHVMVNAYPFFAYESNPGLISLDYALFRPNAGVRDPHTGLLYTNLLDAQLDALYSAMAALGHSSDLRIVVSETGWPNNGDSSETGASIANAAAYNGNLIRHIRSSAGTPMHPDSPVDAFIFALFNENLKPGPSSERNYGLFYPNKQRVYDCGLGSDYSTPRKPKSGGRNNSSSGGNPTPNPSPSASPPQNQNPSPKQQQQQQRWCVAKEGANSGSLQKALDYACGPGNADCAAIQTGSPCFLPNTLQAHASYAFNSYFQKNAKSGGSCDFAGAATLTSSNPSYGGCEFPVV